MAQNYVMIDGKRIDLSNETTDNLKKALNITEPKQVKVMWFRAAKTKGYYPYLIGGCNESAYKWNGKTTVSNSEAYIQWYTEAELKQIIAGLQELLKS